MEKYFIKPAVSGFYQNRLIIVSNKPVEIGDLVLAEGNIGECSEIYGEKVIVLVNNKRDAINVDLGNTLYMHGELSEMVNWLKEGDEVELNSISTKISHYQKRNKNLEVGDLVDTNDNLTGRIKEFLPTKEPLDSWGWSDEVIVTDLRFGPSRLIVDQIYRRDKINDTEFDVPVCDIKCPTCKRFH